MEEFTQIVIAVLGVLGAFDLGRLVFYKAGRKKANAEAEGQEKENASIEVETLKTTIETLGEQLKACHETVTDFEARNRQLSDENGHLKATITALYDDMCVHKGCRIRKPHQGRGQQWYEKYREDPGLGADYLSIDTLMKQDRARRLTLAIEKREHENED